MCIFVFVLILAVIQDQALVASKHYLIETKEKPPVDSAVDHGSKNLLPEELKKGNDEEDKSDYFGSGPGDFHCRRGMHFSWSRWKCVSNFY